MNNDAQETTNLDHSWVELINSLALFVKKYPQAHQISVNYTPGKTLEASFFVAVDEDAVGIMQSGTKVTTTIILTHVRFEPPRRSPYNDDGHHVLPGISFLENTRRSPD